MCVFLEPEQEFTRHCTFPSSHSTFRPGRAAVVFIFDGYMLGSSPVRFLLKVSFLQLENRMVRIWLKVGPVEEVFRPLLVYSVQWYRVL